MKRKIVDLKIGTKIRILKGAPNWESVKPNDIGVIKEGIQGFNNYGDIVYNAVFVDFPVRNYKNLVISSTAIEGEHFEVIDEFDEKIIDKIKNLGWEVEIKIDDDFGGIGLFLKNSKAIKDDFLNSKHNYSCIFGESCLYKKFEIKKDNSFYKIEYNKISEQMLELLEDIKKITCAIKRRKLIFKELETFIMNTSKRDALYNIEKNCLNGKK